jgi:DNA-binding transcriptional LysR family regulator
VTLFERQRQGLTPTQAAIALIETARQMQSNADAIAVAASGQSQQVSGPVRITASAVMSTMVLPSILAKLHQQEPELDIELVSSDSVQNIMQRDADIAVRMVEPTQPDLIATHVNDLAVGFYASRNYLKKHGMPKSPEQLIDGHVLVGYDRQTMIIDGMNRFGFPVTRNDFAVRCDDQLAYFELVKAAMGIGILSCTVASRHKQLVPLFDDLPIPALPVWTVTHRELRTSRRIRRVFDFLTNSLKQLDLS